MNSDFGPAASGGETGCAATVVAVSAGAVDPFRLSGEALPRIRRGFLRSLLGGRLPTIGL